VLMFSVFYASAVLIPQLAQQRFGYTTTWAGLVLSPGGFVVLALIPLVGRLLMPRVQTRFIIAFGLFALGAALFAATRLTPTLSFYDLAFLRALQTFGLAFLFVPNSTISYSTLPKELNVDASSLYVMLRNVSGSSGISLSTAMVVQQTQVHRAYLARHLTPYDQPYQDFVLRLQQSLMGRFAPGQLHQTAEGLANSMLTLQAPILAYIDTVTAAASFAMVPIAFLFAPTKARGQAGAGH
jgi:MFS transporter, DHA2 family, multidrug resistance protein